MNQGEEMLKALQAYQVKPGRAIEFVDKSSSRSRRLMLESYPGVPCYRVSYRCYNSSLDHLSGARSTQVAWRMFYIFGTDTAYVFETASGSHTPPNLPPKRDLKQLAAGARKLPRDFTKATDADLASLWLDLKVWTRL